MGARGKTFEEIIRALHLKDEKDAIAKQFEHLNEQLQQEIGSSTLNIANKIYLKNNYELKSLFAKIAVSNFRSEAEMIDFSKIQESVQTINNWVEAKTEGKIKDLIGSVSITDETRLILVNAIYFKEI